MNSVKSEGNIGVSRIPLLKRPAIRTLSDAIRYGSPQVSDANIARRDWQRANRKNFERSLHDQRAFESGDRASLGNRLGVIGHLWLAKVGQGGGVADLGLASCRVVTTAGVNFIVDAFQNLVELEDMKYHGIGTGTTAEAVGQTALITELSTQYSTSNTRPAGSTGEQSGNANVYETTATITVSASVAATEHGIFSRAATGGGVLLDRSVFAAVNLASGESLQATYSLTFPSGG